MIELTRLTYPCSEFLPAKYILYMQLFHNACISIQTSISLRSISMNVSETNNLNFPT